MSDGSSVVGRRPDTEGTLCIANQEVRIGQCGGDFFGGRGVPGESDTPPD